MSTTYPSAIDNFSNPVGTDPLSSVPHATQHQNANDAIEAIETELGTNVGDRLANFMYWVPVNDDYVVNAEVTAEAVEAVLTLTALPTGQVVKAVTGIVVIQGTVASNLNSIRARNYDAVSGEGQGGIAYASVADQFFSSGFTVQTGGTGGRQMKYQVRRSSGTITYYVMINGYWRIA